MQKLPTLYLRKMSPEVHDYVHSAAGARQWSTTEYVSAVVRLHKQLSEILEGGSDDPARRLERIQHAVEQLGLSPVHH